MTTPRSYRHDMIDMMADEAKRENAAMASAAWKELKRKAEFPARSAGQRNRYSKEKQA